MARSPRREQRRRRRKGVSALILHAARLSVMQRPSHRSVFSDRLHQILVWREPSIIPEDLCHRQSRQGQDAGLSVGESAPERSFI